MKPETLFHLKINHQKGMSFIEVLIALVILVTGILGAVAMQATAKKGSLDALQRSIASALTQDILERMRSNDVNELNNYANTYEAIAPAAITACFTSDTLCDPLALRVEDTLQWQHGLSELIDGVGCIAVNNNQVTITISWQGRESTQDGSISNGEDAAGCGIENDMRRQVLLHAFII
tara:strand:- start:177 stop:710 length:534 start_codon:yes stop_codon:yes gene_type:complete